MKLEDEINELAPWLRPLKENQGGLKTPNSYFEGIEESVFKQIDAIGARKKAMPSTKSGFSWLVWLELFRKPQFSAAFGIISILVVATLWFFAGKTSEENSNPNEYSEFVLTPEEAEAYILNNPDEFEPEHLAAVLESEQEIILIEPISETEAKNSAFPTPQDTISLTPEDLAPLLEGMTDEELEALL